MATCLRVIAAAFWIVMFGASPALSAESGCLKCHPIHYRTKGSCVDCHQGRPDTYRKEIAHHRMIAARFAAFTLESNPVLERGNRLLEEAACRRCHVTGGKGNALAADLDRSLRNAVPEELYRAIDEPALFMPDFRFTDLQLVALVNAIQAEGRKVPTSTGEVPLIIHFEDPGQEDEFIFQKECGACHRALTKQRGGLGTGEVGPNLSGLLSEYYLKNFPEGKAWTIKGLDDWLKNPRKLLKNSRMQPVKLNEQDWRRLQQELLDEKSSNGTK